PYYIALTDLRPDQNPDHCMHVWVVDVDQPLPSHLPIPLAGSERLDFDLNRAYQYTFEVGRWGAHIDYEEMPRNFDSFRGADRERIRQVMSKLAIEVEAGLPGSKESGAAGQDAPGARDRE